MSLAPSTKFSLGSVALIVLGVIVIIVIAYFFVTPNVS